jgi:hypothetical protein
MSQTENLDSIIQQIRNVSSHIRLYSSTSLPHSTRRYIISLNNTASLSNRMDKNKSVGFENFTTVIMKSNIFWDITPYSLLSVNRRFGGTYHLHLQD